MKLLLLSSTLFFYIFGYSTADDEPVSYRLIEHQTPKKYILDLEFKKEIFEGTSVDFNGSLTINFMVARSIQSIQFHAPVTIKSKQFIDNQTYPVPIEEETFDPVTHIYTITAKEKLNYTHDYTLIIEYSSTINTGSMTGVYRSSYVDEVGNTQYFVATHFQPTYARFAFPSFDEPKMKATFLISIIYPKGLTALGNAVQAGETIEIDDYYEKVTFKETPVMSTYLVGFILSKLTCSKGKDINNSIPYQVCSRQELEGDRTLALDLGPPFVQRLENITALNYSDHLLGKLDQVAIPGYTANYMENWGLTTYRESSLLWNTRESSIAYRNKAMDLFLELAHNWFGNLETASWWDYTFLNLGFSRFYQYHAAAEVDEFKSWELENQFVIDQLQSSLKLDALSSASALSYPVETPPEILTKFNTLAYSKAASIIRMAQHVMGPENFQKGVRYFLPIYNGSVIIPIYVWNQLGVFTTRDMMPSTENLNGAMTSWTEKAGFPLVTVTAKGNNIVLTQQRFLYSGEEDFTEWYVPITYTLSEDFNKFENTTTKVWLTPGTSQTLYDILEENEWIILNNQQVGYYRVNYDNSLWEKVKNLLVTNHTSIHVLNRAQIVDDLLNLARANILDYSYAFDIIKYLKYETEYYPWHSAITNFNYLLMQLGEDSVLGSEISSMVLELTESIYESLSFTEVNPEDQVYILKLLTISNAVCKFAEQSCISNAKDLFEQYKAGTGVDKNLRGFVYCNALRYSDSATSDWNFLWESLQSETLTSERETIITALGCTKDTAVLKHYLDQSLSSSSGINLDDVPNVWFAVYTGSSEGVDVAFDYLYENYTKMASYYPSADSILISVIERFTNEEQLKKLETFISQGNVESSVKALAQSALKSFKERLEWVVNIKDDLLDYFEIYAEDTTEDAITTPGNANMVGLSFVKLVAVVVLSKLFKIFL
ncbi:membrane alanyl aminopeptidase-like [Anoplophora glabripennis]|uniref:membrane alanyl aminopeptidase-like n=1 Tax=Anoplophora glabripennis TaxID=217634 RepID=UPI000C78B60E|nr:membrane alanyl aminopeptidase-like [Anoplophora glabripennis]